MRRALSRHLGVRVRLQELDKQMEIMHKKIWEQRQKMGGVNASRENNQAIAKQIQILENRLDKALKRYNEALANNKRLRENIDNLRRERLVFDQIYRKLEKELAEKKKEMARIIEISNKAYEARDAAQSEMSALKAQADKEQEDFEREWKELGKMIEQDRKMKDFMKKEREKLSQQVRTARPRARAVACAHKSAQRLALRRSHGHMVTWSHGVG